MDPPHGCRICTLVHRRRQDQVCIHGQGFASSADPVIDDFLAGDQTEEKWTEFIAYLQEQHGRSKRVQARSVISGTPREGRRPSQLVAAMEQKAGKVTLDDIMKEQLVKELPQEVRTLIATEVDTLTFRETGKLADKYFDSDGKLKEDVAPKTSVHSVQQQRAPKPQNVRSDFSAAPTDPQFEDAPGSASFTAPFLQGEDGSDINAVRFKQGQRQSFNVQNRSRGRGNPHSNRGSRGNYNNNQSSSRPRNYNDGNKDNKKAVCSYHVNFGDKAINCEPTCMMWAKHAAAKGKASQ